MSEECHGCIGEIKKQREAFRQIINQARELAKKENTIITIYRTESGDISLEPTGQIHSYITPYLQNT